MSPNSALTLYDAEDYLSAMLETEGAVEPALEEQFKLELRAAIGAAVDKRERVGRFILHCENQAKFAREEVQRISKKARAFENVAERIRKYVLGWIVEKGLDAKGKLPKLEGHTVTMSARACAASVEITDEALIPLGCKLVTVEMPAEDWLKLLANAADIEDFAIPADQVYSVDKSELKRLLGTTAPCTNCDATGSLAGAIECEACGATGRVTQTVPGARLVKDKMTLQVK